MGVNFFETLEHRAARIKSHLCVGIDPHPEFVSKAEQLLSWCLELAEATAPVALCFKVNIAFFEAFGAPGISVLEQLIPALKAHAPLILDAKRGDIGSTAAAYAAAVHDRWSVEALTVNPYLGLDGIEPYLRYPQAGLFVLCHTSNPSAASLQTHRDLGGEMLYEKVLSMVDQHPERDRMGLVVGATQAEALFRVRKRSQDIWLLCPGVGAQGGDLRTLIRAGWGSDGHLLISSSRSIARATSPASAARELRDQIRAEADQLTALHQEEDEAIYDQLARVLLEADCVLFGQFKLKSGLTSPIYIDLRRLTGHPNALKVVLDAYLLKFKSISRSRRFDALAGLPLAGLPLATGLSLYAQLPLCYPRPPKSHGTRSSVEGGVQEGSHLLMVDDLATRGVSALDALTHLRADHENARHCVHDLLVLIDRQSGAEEVLADAGVTLHSVITLSRLIERWRHLQLVPEADLEATLRFISESEDKI